MYVHVFAEKGLTRPLTAHRYAIFPSPTISRETTDCDKHYRKKKNSYTDTHFYITL